jgi:hypothetical protein
MKRIIVGVVTVLSFTCFCYAQQTPQALRDQAVNQVTVATELAQKAKGLIGTGTVSRENLIAAAQLYVQAGQMFEQAGNTFRSLGKGYVSQEDIDNCDNAVRFCIESINNIKRILGVKEIPVAPATKPGKTLVSP